MLQESLQIILFLICIIFGFYLPGKFLINKLHLKLDGIEELFVAPVTGIVFFTLFAYLFSCIHAEWIIVPALIIINFLVIKKNKKLFPQIPQKFHSSIIFVVVASLIFSSSLLLFGIYGNHVAYRLDDLWHLSLIHDMKQNFPPDIPTYAGPLLKGYHFFFDFLMAKISNIFFLSPYSLYFHHFSIFLSLLWGFGVFTLMYAWTKKISASLIAVFLTMFGGSFAYILHFQGHTEVGLSNGIGILQPANSIYNPPFSISVIILLFCLFLLYRYLQTHEKRWMIPFVIGAGILPMFKVYAGIVLFGGLFLVVLYELLKKRFFLLEICFLIGIVFVGTYWIFVGGYGGLIWHPFWPPHELLKGFAWYGYDEKIATYTQLGVIRGLIETEAYGFSLFLLGNLGTRIFGLLILPFLWWKNRKSPSIFALSTTVMLLISIGVPLLFLQTGKVFEIIQMANYYLLFCSLFAAIGLSYFLTLRFHISLKIVFLIIFVLLTLPSAVSTYWYMAKDSGKTTSLSDPYFKALIFLQRQGTYNDTVLEFPTQYVTIQKNPLRYMYDFSSPVVPAFSGKRTYLTNVGFTFPGMDLDSRLQDFAVLIQFMNKPTALNAKRVESILKRQNIRYILSPENMSSLLKINGVKEIYKDSYYIYQFE